VGGNFSHKEVIYGKVHKIFRYGKTPFVIFGSIGLICTSIICLMLYFDQHSKIQHSIRCYQELRRDAIKVLLAHGAMTKLTDARFSLFSSRKQYRHEELILGLHPFAGYSFGIN
jgi:hypothetical protein